MGDRKSKELREREIKSDTRSLKRERESGEQQEIKARDKGGVNTRCSHTER